MAIRFSILHACLALCLLVNVGCHGTMDGRCRQAEPDITDKAIRKLLWQAIRDDQNELARSLAGDSKIAMAFGGRRPWFPIFPVQYAGERLMMHGKVIVGPLLQIMADPNEKQALVFAAAGTLSTFDDPRILRAYVDAARSQRISAANFGRLLTCYRLQVPKVRLLPMEYVEQIIWLDQELWRYGYEETLLRSLDRYLSPESYNLMEGHRTPSAEAMQWLNRIYDRDLDDWLADKAPRALEFRNRALRTGYDPLVVLASLNPVDDDSILKEAVSKGIFSCKDDKAAFVELCEAVYPSVRDGPFDPPPDRKGWTTRLRSWYRENRNSFVYDYERHRFVVNDKQVVASQPGL